MTVVLELAELAAGFPLAASFAIAGGIGAYREGRRRTSLNEAMHELRRPLQILALSLPADARAAGPLDSSLRMAAAALERLDREINGGEVPAEDPSVSMRGLVEAAVARGRVRAAGTGRHLSLRWRARDSYVQGDGIELEQAVDNMISNGFDHGSGAVVVEVAEACGRLYLRVLDSGCPDSSPRGRGRASLRRRLGGRSRHGHGLKVARRAAKRHGGRFRLRRSPTGTEARLELPAPGGRR
ncbi:MAG TPA: ATP-binding protein [Solirubrobacterales bacterium]|nr:ATP-binding protein [Solirubrobacterales bacterium]